MFICQRHRLVDNSSLARHQTAGSEKFLSPLGEKGKNNYLDAGREKSRGKLFSVLRLDDTSNAPAERKRILHQKQREKRKVAARRRRRRQQQRQRDVMTFTESDLESPSRPKSCLPAGNLKLGEPTTTQPKRTSAFCCTFRDRAHVNLTRSFCISLHFSAGEPRGQVQQPKKTRACECVRA